MSPSLHDIKLSLLHCPARCPYSEQNGCSVDFAGVENPLDEEILFSIYTSLTYDNFTLMINYDHLANFNQSSIKKFQLIPITCWISFKFDFVGSLCITSDLIN